MCGILGMIGPEPVGRDLVLGLTALQHRGQDAAGVTTLSDRFHTRKAKGLVNQVFRREEHVAPLVGKVGIGHVRYATQGTNTADDAQPMAVNYPFGIAVAHNGNVTNFVEVKERLGAEHFRLVQTANDAELILYWIAQCLEKKNLAKMRVEDVWEVVRDVQEHVRGAYSVVCVIAGQGLLAFRDTHGLRPLMQGARKAAGGTAHAFASESTCFDFLGFESLGEVPAGGAVLVSESGEVHSMKPNVARPTFCSFEYVYFAREDSDFGHGTVSDLRESVGIKLAMSVCARGLKPDVVIDAPSTAFHAAFALAEELGVPYRRGLSKNNHVGRSFIAPTQAERERVLRQKLNPVKSVVAGKKVLVVDDSIVRGTTSKRIVSLLKSSGATEVYFASAAPPVRHPCVYGIDMATHAELASARMSESELCTWMGADAVIFQELEAFKQTLGDRAGCYACFTGEYPTGVSDAERNTVSAERVLRRG